MLLKKTNIEEKIQRLKTKANTESYVLNAVEEILKIDDAKDERIIKSIKKTNSTNSNSFNFDYQKPQTSTIQT